LVLGITSVLWVTLLLFQFRIVNIFDAYLMKFPGPLVIWSIMLFCPLLAAYFGIKMIRSRQNLLTGWVFTISGGFLLIAFIVLIGIPIIIQMVTPETPARIIVFRVAGTIELKSELQISHPFITIAGQTAPGGGICIKNAGITIITHDVLIQHIRVRPGNKGPVDADINDAVSILGRHGNTDGAYNVVLDHISASWSEDETVSTWYGAHDITISWSIISEALNRSRHRKKTHSAGLLIGDSSYNVSVHHNLLAHNDFRNPLISEGGTHDIVNNVIYNWGILPAEIVDYGSNTFLNFVGNYFIAGPSTNPGPYEIFFPEGDPKIYVRDNIGPHRSDPNMDEWAIVGFKWGQEGIAPAKHRSTTKLETPHISTHAAAEAMEIVLAEAGATVPQRDAVDRRIVNDVKNRTGKIIDSPDQVGGYPNLAGETPPVDSDHDGMPDEWERQMKLNPQDASETAIPTSKSTCTP